MRRGQPLRREAPAAEDLLWAALKAFNARGYHFRKREFYRSFRLDFVEHDILLAIDLIDGAPGEGFARTSMPENFVKTDHPGSGAGVGAHALSPDVARAYVLHQAGYTILRFWRDEVMADPEAAYTTLETVLEDRPPSDAGS